MPECHATPVRPPCGTDAGYQAHRRNREPYDEACRTAHAAEMATYRRTNPDRRVRERLDQRAREAAWRDLAAERPVEFAVLFHAHRQRLYAEAGVEV